MGLSDEPRPPHQGGLLSGANTEPHFGRFEGALDSFYRTVQRELAAVG